MGEDEDGGEDEEEDDEEKPALDVEPSSPIGHRFSSIKNMLGGIIFVHYYLRFLFLLRLLLFVRDLLLLDRDSIETRLSLASDIQVSSFQKTFTYVAKRLRPSVCPFLKRIHSKSMNKKTSNSRPYYITVFRLTKIRKMF